MSSTPKLQYSVPDAKDLSFVQPALKASKKRRALELSVEEKLEARRAINRRAAFRSRMRKRVLIEDLQQSVEDLLGTVERLDKEKNELCKSMEILFLENLQLKAAQTQFLAAVAKSDNISTLALAPMMPRPSLTSTSGEVMANLASMMLAQPQMLASDTGAVSLTSIADGEKMRRVSLSQESAAIAQPTNNSLQNEDGEEEEEFDDMARRITGDCESLREAQQQLFAQLEMGDFEDD